MSRSQPANQSCRGIWPWTFPHPESSPLHSLHNLDVQVKINISIIPLCKILHPFAEPATCSQISTLLWPSSDRG